MKSMTTKRWLALLLGIAMLFTMTACGEKADSDNGKDNGHAGPIIGEKRINAVDYGLDNTGETDVTEQMIEMHEKGAELDLPIYYPNGTYLFNGTKLDFTSGVEFESQDGVLIRNSISDTPIVNFDNAGNLIGLMHNHLELIYDKTDEWVENGNLVSPPISTAEYETKLDLIPYWYNDFGLRRNFASTDTWNGWYDWRWNHHDCETLGTEENPYDPYDPNLHPLLGFYRGDHEEALDWICYWLQEYGMKQTILMANKLNMDNWEDPLCGTHWLYSLLNKTPNAKNMDFSLWLASTSFSTDEATIRAEWWQAFDEFYFNETYQDMVYCYEIDGKRYPVVFLWDENSVRYSLGNENGALLNLYNDVVQAFKDNGYDGVCILARTPCFANEGGAAIRATMAATGVMWYSVGYPNNCVGSGSTYEERSGKFLTNPDTSCVYGVSTALDTHTPHPSNWTCPGSTPELFGNWLSDAIEATVGDKTRPQMVTCYNVSEWAEGRSGLVPTVGDGFGYLETIRDNLVIS